MVYSILFLQLSLVTYICNVCKCAMFYPVLDPLMCLVTDNDSLDFSDLIFKFSIILDYILF